ncbi:unnamed protein product [Rotaria magnacalcarata]|uniref:Uncharacterized protein n=5 Tax=Rotaria magnacalcarata TaxID=392030 RepID=A0A816F956_9BILA|nr:unnamed protein product [Rotaria magnacalcarata]
MESDSNNMADDEVVDFQDKISIENIADVFELCQATCPVRYLSVLMYISLRHLGIKWTDSDNILRQIGAFKSETSHKWSKAFLSGDFDEFVSENRGGKHSPDFWNYFPEIEISAKQFTLERCSQKVASFTSMDLALFIGTAYYETIGITKDTDSELIRSVSSCRNDLRWWGATFKENGARPYFEGHERQDVVESRKAFIDSFLSRKDSFYTVSDDPQLPGWQVPTKQNPSIILFHDESTFKSGKVAPKRWFFGDSAPFYSKSKGRSNMISDFVVAHPSGPFFSLNPVEYARALQKYHQLGAPTDLEYVLNTASASLNVGYDNYLDNAAVLGQCERLFQMIEFKECFKGHTIECVFEQARTHTAKSHSVNDFSRSVGTKCTVDKIQSCEKLCAAIECLQEINDSHATVVYLSIIRCIIIAFIDPSTPTATRIYYAWLAVFVCRLWRTWLNLVPKQDFNDRISQMANHSDIAKDKFKQKTTKKCFFITSTAFLCIELNAHNLTYLTLLVAEDQLPLETLKVSLFNSQTCENFFRLSRSMSGTFSTSVNFSVQQFLNRQEKISFLNSIKTQSNSSYPSSKFVFPSHHKTQQNHKYSTIQPEKITKQQVQVQVDRAFKDAVTLLLPLGIEDVLKEAHIVTMNQVNQHIRNDLYKSTKKANFFIPMTIDECTNESDSDSEESTSQDDDENQSNGLYSWNDDDSMENDIEDNNGINLLPQTTNTSLQSMKGVRDTINPELKDSYFLVNIDGKRKYLHKNTAIWYMTDEKQKLSSDRLKRVMEN